jgi:hypothetical protein
MIGGTQKPSLGYQVPSNGNLPDFRLHEGIQRRLPKRSEAETETLRNQIRDGRHLDPLVIGVVKGERFLADGYGRLDVCRELGIELHTIPMRDKKFDSEEQMVHWAIRNQLGRRNLGDSQRAILAAELITTAKGRPGKCADLHTFDRMQASAEADVSERTISAAREVLDNAAPSVAQAVRDGEVTVNDAANILDEPKKVQAQAVKDVKAGKARTATAAARPRTRKAQKAPNDAKIATMFEDLAGAILARGKVCEQGKNYTALCLNLDKAEEAWKEWRAEKADESDARPSSGRFVKPTVEEVAAYCKERTNKVDAETFVDFYESKGWKVGKVGMKDWKASVRTWEKGRNESDGKKRGSTPAQPHKEFKGGTVKF